MLFRTFMSLMVMCLLGMQTAYADDVTIEEFALKNGLQVIVIPNHRVPAVSQMIWFPTGGADDPLGKSGLTHFHEHAMFKGTSKFPAGQFETIVSQLGGDQNAFTSYDTTSYYINIDKAHLARAMELEADRLRGLTPIAADMIKEREVIIEERRMRVDNNPRGLFAEQLNSILFVHHPYGTPLIGWKHEMEQLALQDVLAFHQAYYRVNHAILVLAGDITAEEAKPLVEAYYGDLEPGPAVPPRIWVTEPPARAAKRLVMHHELQSEPYLEKLYLAPSVVYGETKQALPLMVLAEYLGGGQTSVLYQELAVKQKLATSISASYNGFSLGPDNFSIGATPAPGVSVETLEHAIDEVVQKTLSAPLNASDIERAKTGLKAETLYAREGLQGMAYMVGFTKMLGLPTNYINMWSSLVDAVKEDDIRNAAHAVIKPEGSVTGILLPSKQGIKQ